MKPFFFQILTFGCKVSQYESQALFEHWVSLNGMEVESPVQAEVILVASCAVTAEAVSDARQAVRKLGREAPKARVIVSGCAATAAPVDFRLPGVIAVIPQLAKARLLKIHPLAPAEDFQGLESSLIREERTVFPPFQISSFRRERPVLKVQDGCSHGCTYCIVPKTRGQARSRDPKEILDEACRLLLAGHRELIISGVNLRQYHFGKYNFWALLRLLNKKLMPEWQGRARLRLSSLDPAQLDAEGLESLGLCSLVCPHLHLSIQSGSATLLRRMGRKHYSPESVLESIGKVRDFWPIFGLGADILMGFPGETQTELTETDAFVQALPLTYAHVFPYSSRPGTIGENLSDHLPKIVRQERAAQIRSIVERKKETFLLNQRKMTEFKIVLDGSGGQTGLNEYYAPCQLDSGILEENSEILTVRPVGMKGWRILCVAHE